MSKKVLIISTSPRKNAGGVNGVGEIDGHSALAQAYEMGKAV